MKILPPAGSPVGTCSASSIGIGETAATTIPLTYPKLKGCCIPGLGGDVPPVCGNFVTSVKNQKSCGDCWAFSVTGALESQFLIKFLTPGKNLNLSEQIVTSCAVASCNCNTPPIYRGCTSCNGASNEYGCDGGWTTDAAQFLHDQGTGLESCYPFKAKDQYEGALCSKACLNWHFLPYQLNSSDYGTSPNPAVQDLKNTIISYGPIAVTLGVYDDFFYYKKGVYQYTWGLI